FAARLNDISDVLGALEVRAPRHQLPVREASHGACHPQHSHDVRGQPRRIPKPIAWLEIPVITEAAICCGSAGIYSLIEPKPAEELGVRKVKNVLSTGADLVASSNLGCLLQSAKGLERACHPPPVVHLVELVDASIRGVMP